MTIKAYHATTPEAFEYILEGGAILPAAVRVDPETLREFCRQEIMYEHKHVYPREVIAALRDLVEEKAMKYEGRRALWRIQADPGEFHASCLEYISGGTDFVYLQTNDWESRVVEMFSGGQPWGFVFDAVELITMGAILFSKTLDTWLDESLRGYHHSRGKDARKFVLNTIDAFFRDDKNNVKYGTEAIRWIQPISRRFTLPVYLGWEGPLPVSFAVEFWKEGRRVRNSELQTGPRMLE